MIQNGDKEMLVKFEGMRELLAHLPNAIDKLQKNGRSIGIGMMIVTVANALLEFVTKTEPLLFDEYLEAFHCAVIGVK